jgi:phage terminase large subunit-like protein
MIPGATQVRLGERQFWSTGGLVIQFIESHCVLTNARWTGQPFKLLPWQKRILWELFEIDPETGLRRYRRALIGVPRKNGKSELAAAIALYLMLADGEKSSQVYCAAGSEEQADLVFEAAKRMCSLDGAPLAGLVQVESRRLTSRADPYSYFERLSSKGKTKHGLSPHGVVFDELHVWGMGEHDELWDALTTGSGARSQPLQVAITTAGQDVETSRCGGLYQHGRAMEEGREQDDSFYFRWFAAPDGCDYRDPQMWRIANPSWGVTVNEQFLRGELAGTNTDGTNRAGAITEASFRRLYLNQWIEWGETPWVTREQLTACRVPRFELRPDIPSWVGCDVSEHKDATAVTAGQFWDGDDRPCGHTGEPCLYVRARAWEPLIGANGRPMAGWRVPHGEVKRHISNLNASLDVASNVFDPWHSGLLQSDLMLEGVFCEQIHQTGQRRSEASSRLYDLIVQERIHYCDDVVERHCMNATIKASGTDGGYFLTKRRQGKLMDVAMSLVNVCYGFINQPSKSTGDVQFYVWEGDDE